MKRWVLLAVFLSNFVTLSAQDTNQDSTRISPWRAEYQVMLGNSVVREVDGYDQPTVGVASRAVAFALGLEYRLCAQWALHCGIISDARTGQAWANGTPFEISEEQLDFPVLLRVSSWNPLGMLPEVGLEFGFGGYYGMVLFMDAHEIPGVNQPLARDADLGFMDYHHLGVAAEIRIRIRLSERNDVSVGIHMLQDLVTFGYDDGDPILPQFNVSTISIGYSRPF